MIAQSAQELETMGRVTVPATIENLEDLWEVEKGLRRPEDVRRVSIEKALVDTGATTLGLPARLIEQLGLRKLRDCPYTSARGTGIVGVYGLVQLSLMDRDCRIEVMEISEQAPPLIGQIPLELMDLLVDPKGRKLVGNPEHGGQQMLELY